MGGDNFFMGGDNFRPPPRFDIVGGKVLSPPMARTPWGGNFFGVPPHHGGGMHTPGEVQYPPDKMNISLTNNEILILEI